jgi:hypothetical protein
MGARDENCIEFWLENMKGRNHLEYPGIDGRF